MLEHIPKNIIKDISLEAERILKPGSAAVLFVDLSDHFQHLDRSISRINFLRFSAEEWQRIAGNEFAYCNRLRASQYKELLAPLDFTIGREEYIVDRESLAQIQENTFFKVDSMFSLFSPKELCTVSLRILLKKQCEYKDKS